MPRDGKLRQCGRAKQSNAAHLGAQVFHQGIQDLQEAKGGRYGGHQAGGRRYPGTSQGRASTVARDFADGRHHTSPPNLCCVCKRRARMLVRRLILERPRTRPPLGM